MSVKSSEFALSKVEPGLEAVEGQGGNPTDSGKDRRHPCSGQSFSSDSHLPPPPPTPSVTEKPGTSALGACVA